MTDEEINIAIAEACGWWGNCKENCMRPPNCTDMYCEIPNYCNDLNAMHEVEKMLTDDQRWEQAKWIVDYRQAANGFPMLSRSETLKLYSATARQRAEAFLKTLNLWKQ